MRYTVMALMIVLPVAGLCGNLEPTSGPDDIGSAMFTIQDIYNRLTLGTPGTKDVFSEPSIAPGPTGHTLDNVMSVAPSGNNANGAVPGDVLSGRSYWGLRTDGQGWGLRTGSMANRGGLNFMPRTYDQVIAAGYHDGTGLVAGDPDLSAANIAAGINIFGVVGNAPIATGTAVAGHVLSGVTFSSTSGSGLTGSMPNRGSLSIMPSAANQNIQPGYYSGGGVSGDPDLVPGNIMSGRNIFNVVGTALAATGNATPADVRTGRTFSNNGGSATGTMQDRSLSALNTTVGEGYYTGTTLNTVDTDLITANIRSGVTIFGVAGDPNVVNTSAGDATAAQILTGRIAFVDGAQITGTVAAGGNITGANGSAVISIASGLYTGAETVTAVDTDLTAGNIRNGVTIFGVTGDPNVVNTATGTATAAQMLNGSIAFVGGAQVTGTVTAGANVTGAEGILGITIPNGLYVGTETATAVDADLVAGNILNGVNLFGVDGTVFQGAVSTTGQTTCYNAAGGIILCAGTGQDGNLQNGVTQAGPRFTVNADTTVTDNLTGLVWAPDANDMRNLNPGDPGYDTDENVDDGRVYWATAFTYIGILNAANYLGHNDWRLPNIRELFSIVEFEYSNWSAPDCLPAGHPFLNTMPSGTPEFWTSTTVASWHGAAWTVDMGDAATQQRGKTALARHVWPVRGGS